MAELLFALRLIHVVSGIGWLGEVITINFVLLPALFKANAKDQLTLLNTVFPYIFRLATVLGGAAVLSGLTQVLLYTGFNLSLLFYSRWGWLLLIGGTMGMALYTFHLFQESGAERTLATDLAFAIAGNDREAVTALLRKLAIFPRAGMILLVIIISLMIAAAHLSFS